ncbi:MAG: hypothetical protein ABJM83_16935, partial [Paracoccaceae bacterium]
MTNSNTTEKPASDCGSSELFADLYGLDRWGDDLLSVGDDGALSLCNPAGDTPPVSLPSIMDALTQRGISAPIMLRVQPFLDRSLTRLHDAFAAAFKDRDYKGEFRGVFPIKVNQQSEVIERLSDAGKAYHFGL